MEVHELADVAAAQAAGGRPYHEFIQVPDLSVGLYVLPAGGVDRQQPHREDEVYYVLEGAAQLTVDGATRPVRPGTVVYVAAGQAHRFHDIAADLRLLVFFAPAETPPDPPA